MAMRSEKLNRLVIASECRASWDEMQGDGAQRFCAECQREVFDFAQMTEREIRARIETSQGRLCARLTRRAGQLAVAPAPELFAQSAPWEPRRVSPLAVTVVTAWLSLGAATTQAAEPSAPAAGAVQEGAGRDAKGDRAPRPAPAAGGAALHGRIVEEGGAALPGAEVVARNALDGRQHATRAAADGTFVLDQLPTGVYDLTATLAGFEITPQSDISLQAGEGRRVDLTARSEETQVLLGDLAVDQEPIHRLFAESDLVIVARVGSSSASVAPGSAATELQIESLFKGKVSGRKVTYQRQVVTHQGQVIDGGPHPGSRILAFLKASRETGAPGEAPSFEAADYGYGVKELGDAELASYVARVEALARLDRAAGRRGEEDPAERMEWLVATAEDLHTRGEAVSEIRTASEALAEVAANEGTTVELAAADLQALVKRFRGEGGKLSEAPRPAFLGAALTEGQKQRLTKALLATRRLENPDLSLFAVVRGWNEAAAMTWLVRELRTGQPTESGELERLAELAMDLQDERLEELATAALEREQEIEEHSPEAESAASQGDRQRELADLRKELRHRFADVLASAQ
jgi:hypothetical protein